MVTIRALALGAALGMSGLGAQASILDFSGTDFTPGTVVSGSPLDFGGGVTGVVTTTGPSGQVSVIDTEEASFANGGTARDRDLQSPFQRVLPDGTPADGGTVTNEFASFGNALIIQSNNEPVPDDQAGGGIMRFTFNQIVQIRFIDLLDIEELSSISIDGMQVGDALKVNNSGCTGLYSGTVPNLTCSGDGPNQFMRFFVNQAVNTDLEITFGGSGAVGQIALVPLPAAVLLMLGGIGGLAGVRHIQRRKAA